MSMEQAQKATVRKIQEYVNLRGKKVLEVGCGDGRLTALFAAITQSLVAIDPDIGRVEQAKARVPGIDFRIGSGECLEFEDASFDVILFTLSLHHQNSTVALQEAYRVIRADGRVIVVEPSGAGQMEQLCRLFHYEAVEQDQAQQAILNSDFEVEHHAMFTTEWVFANIDEVYSGLCSHYNVELSKSIMADIDGILGKKRGDRPLVVNDVLQLHCLRKRG